VLGLLRATDKIKSGNFLDNGINMFVLACTALLLLAMTNHVKALCFSDFQSSIRTFFWLAAPLLMAAPVITTIYDAARFSSGAEVSPSQV